MSRALDKLVAERVMGLMRLVPLYSYDIGTAWQVVEALRKLPWYRGIEITDTATQGGGWAVFMHEKRDGTIEPVTRCLLAPTAPYAICIAALRACGVSESEIEMTLPEQLRGNT